MRKLALHWKIILGMVFGVIFALILINFSWGPQFISDWIKPFGTIFINALKLIAVPLIFASLVKGISDLKDMSKFSKMGIRTICLYIVMIATAATIGLVVVNTIEPGNAISEQTREQLVEEYQGQASIVQQSATDQQKTGPLQPLVNLVPDNIIAAAGNNTNMLQVIFFAIFFGITLILIPEKTAKPVKKFFDGFNAAILKMIDIIMKAAPFGVFALLAALVAEAPSLELFKALGFYALCVILGLFIMLLVYMLLIWIFARRSPRFFENGIFPAQLVAFSTSSSAATLPVTMEQTEKHLGVDQEVTSFVLPIGATVNMDGTSLYQAVAAVFIAQAFGMDLTLAAQAGIVLTATLASIGAAAVPSAGIVMLVIVLSQAGIPAAGLALIFAVDRPLDMSRTIINITGDAAISMLVAKSIGKLHGPEAVPERDVARDTAPVKELSEKGKYKPAWLLRITCKKN